MFKKLTQLIIFLHFVAATPALAQDTGKTTTGEPGGIYIHGAPINEFLMELRRNKYEPQKQIETLRMRVFGREGGAFPLTGFASLIERSLPSVGSDVDVTSSNPKCEAARKAKTKWHIENTGQIPDSFGQIVRYGVYEVNPRERTWEGRIDLCTWIGNDEYYFEMRFHSDAWIVRKLTAREHSGDRDDPFPFTLDMSRLDQAGKAMLLQMIADGKWAWKLHAGGDAIEFLTAQRNGVDLDRATDRLFQDPNENCFDIFFRDVPQDYTLPEQLGYCMGRCDARILNTH